MTVYSDIEHVIFGERDRAPTLGQETPPPVFHPAALEPATGMASPLESPPLVPLFDVIDVEAILDHRAGALSGSFDWRHRVTDLLKVCGLPATAANRKALGDELQCEADVDDAVLLSVLMRKLEDDGATVPADMK